VAEPPTCECCQFWALCTRIESGRAEVAHSPYVWDHHRAFGNEVFAANVVLRSYVRQSHWPYG
jgi:hypothetical protein